VHHGCYCHHHFHTDHGDPALKGAQGGDYHLVGGHADFQSQNAPSSENLVIPSSDSFLDLGDYSEGIQPAESYQGNDVLSYGQGWSLDRNDLCLSYSLD